MDQVNVCLRFLEEVRQIVFVCLYEVILLAFVYVWYCVEESENDLPHAKERLEEKEEEESPSLTQSCLRHCPSWVGFIRNKILME